VGLGPAPFIFVFEYGYDTGKNWNSFLIIRDHRGWSFLSLRASLSLPPPPPPPTPNITVAVAATILIFIVFAVED
jgi:hypothetical protein